MSREKNILDGQHPRDAFEGQAPEPVIEGRFARRRRSRNASGTRQEWPPAVGKVQSVPNSIQGQYPGDVTLFDWALIVYLAFGNNPVPDRGLAVGMDVDLILVKKVTSGEGGIYAQTYEATFEGINQHAVTIFTQIESLKSDGQIVTGRMWLHCVSLDTMFESLIGKTGDPSIGVLNKTLSNATLSELKIIGK